MKQTSKRFPVIVSASLAVSILMMTASAAVAAGNPSAPTPKSVSKYEKVDITEITGEVVEPPMLTSAASSVAKEKEWYEYVYYSPYPVAYCYLSDNTRLAFYDPYDYADALVMEVDDTLTEWSSNNSMQVSYTTGNSLTDTTGESTTTTTSTLRGYTDEETTLTGKSVVTTQVDNHTDSYSTSKTVTDDNSISWGISENIGAETATGSDIPIGKIKVSASLDIGSTQQWKTGKVYQYQEGLKDGDKDAEGHARTGYTVSNNTTTVTNDEHSVTVTNEIADRVTEATGYVNGSSIALSTNNSTTVTKTYEAGYFNDRGAPLPWKIVEYTVKMPMRFQVEYLIDGEWIYGDSSYCLLNTIQGTCRAWMQNNTAYYEHWGTGEPVTWDGFWSQFFTPDSLVAAYKNRIYPEN